MVFSDDAKAVIALTTRLGDSSRPALPPTQWDAFWKALPDGGRGLAEVLDPGFDPFELNMPTDLARKAEELLRGAQAAWEAAIELDEMGIWTLTIVDDGYPKALRQRLGRLAPPVIWGVGPSDLLGEQGIGVVGPRDVEPDGAAVAREIGEVVAKEGYTLVSGGSRGVDALAMNAAFMAGGKVLGILADSLQARARKPEVLHALERGHIALLSRQVPSAGFSIGAAMSRNKLIYAMSHVTLVVAAGDESGGTRAGAAEALNKSNGVVAVWMGPGRGPGNESLVESGARPVTTSEEVLACLETEPDPDPEPEPDPEPVQERLRLSG